MATARFVGDLLRGLTADHAAEESDVARLGAAGGRRPIGETPTPSEGDLATAGVGAKPGTVHFSVTL